MPQLNSTQKDRKKSKSKQKDWRYTDEGWRGFFQGYATAEKDALRRYRDRADYLVVNFRSILKAGKSETELLAFLDRIEAKHA